MRFKMTYSSILFNLFFCSFLLLSTANLSPQLNLDGEEAFKLFINLTEDEKQWIEEHKTISIGDRKVFHLSTLMIRREIRKELQPII